MLTWKLLLLEQSSSLESFGIFPLNSEKSLHPISTLLYNFAQICCSAFLLFILPPLVYKDRHRV